MMNSTTHIPQYSISLQPPVMAADGSPIHHIDPWPTNPLLQPDFHLRVLPIRDFLSRLWDWG
jgi:hypothetical protein